jgi:hypothetical protein
MSKGLGMYSTMLLTVILALLTVGGFVTALIWGGYLSFGQKETPTDITDQEKCIAKGYEWDAGKQVCVAPPVATGACNPEGSPVPQIRAAYHNAANETNTEYLVSAAARVYSGNHSSDVSIPATDYVGTINLATTGYPASGSGFLSVICGNTYTIVVPSTNANTVSAMTVVKMNHNEELATLEGAYQQPLIFRVYDEDNRNYVYANTEATATTWVATASSFYSTTGNATIDSDGLTLGAGASYKYLIYGKTNTTASSKGRFTDPLGELLIGVDVYDASDWAEPVITATYYNSALNVVKESCPSKIANDGNEFCYKLTDPSLGGPPVVSNGRELVILVQGEGKSGVDVSDDTNVSYYVSGWVQRTGNEGSFLTFNKDDSSETYIYTAQKVHLLFG